MNETTPDEVSLAGTLRHIADDHPCCKGSLLAHVAYIEALEGRVAYLEGSIPDDPRAEADLIDARRIRQERDDAVLAHHLALARIEALDATARAERSHSMSVEEDLERMDKVIEYWKNLAERLRARIEELEKLASHEAHCACVPTLEARIEALENQKCERCGSELFVRCLVCAGDEPAALAEEKP
jgi:FMN phosphatase YigB (HAD superfamily)